MKLNIARVQIIVHPQKSVRKNCIRKYLKLGSNWNRLTGNSRVGSGVAGVEGVEGPNSPRRGCYDTVLVRVKSFIYLLFVFS